MTAAVCGHGQSSTGWLVGARNLAVVDSQRFRVNCMPGMQFTFFLSLISCNAHRSYGVVVLFNFFGSNGHSEIPASAHRAKMNFITSPRLTDLAVVAGGIVLGVVIATFLRIPSTSTIAKFGDSTTQSIEVIATLRKNLELETEQGAGALALRESVDQTPFHNRDELWMSFETLSKVKGPTFSEWDGALHSEFAALLGLSDAETTEVNSIVLGARNDMKSLEKEMAKIKHSADGALEGTIPPFPQEGEALKARLFGELRNLVGHNRATILLQASDNSGVFGNFGQLTQTISMVQIVEEQVSAPSLLNVRVFRQSQGTVVNGSAGPIEEAIFTDRYGHLLD